MTQSRAPRDRFAIITLWLLLLVFGSHLAGAEPPVQGTAASGIDLMILIDNSCSIFPAAIAQQHNCDEFGNDPSNLRIIGSDIFFASLGLGEASETDYQVGVISFAGPPNLISPLQPVGPVRGQLATMIANPIPVPRTEMVPALNMAYDHLRSSPNRRPTNPAALVLLTDGIPYPPDEQPNADIEQLLAQNPDVSLFVMLLQNNADANPADYAQYVSFWQQMQSTYPHVFTYFIDNPQQIDETYNQIIAQLQDTIPSEGIPLQANVPLDVFVSSYVQRLVVKILHDPAVPRGRITISDPRGIPIADSEPGVVHFRDPSNPVEVISIGPGRLDLDNNNDGIPDLKNDIWTIESDAAVLILLDRRGAYNIRFSAPNVIGTQVSNVYQAPEPQSPDSELIIAFSLVDTNGNVILEPQPIQAKVIHPDATEAILPISPGLLPDEQGTYQLRYLVSDTYVQPIDRLSRFIFIINAGSADQRAAEVVPITTARLSVDFGRQPFIADVVPVTCAAGQPAELRVTVGNYESSQPDSVSLRLFAGGEELFLEPAETGTYIGDLSALCADLTGSLACSTSSTVSHTLRLSGQTAEGVAFRSQREVELTINAPACPTSTPPPPTPTPPPTATPLPPPTPVPDSDGDSIPDPEDDCADTTGWAMFDGCPPEWWHWLIAGIASVALVGFVAGWGYPWLKVNTFARPPAGFILVCKTGEKNPNTINVRNVGLDRRASAVTIGSNRKKAHIFVDGLEDIEFRVERAGEKTVIVKTSTGQSVRNLNDGRGYVHTSNAKITLQVSLKGEELKC